MSISAKRTELLHWLRRQLIGPGSYEERLRGISPVDRYPTGVLFPVIRGESGIDPASEEQEDDEADPVVGDDRAGSESPEPTKKKRRYTPPSSLGFSFFIRGEKISLNVRCAAVRYERVGERDPLGRYIGQDWNRIPLKSKDGDADAVTFTPQSEMEKYVWDGKAKVDALWRPFADGWIVTVSLSNTQVLDADSGHQERVDRNERSLFEVAFNCAIDDGEVGAYPRVDKSLLSEEEQELELQYKNRKIYAIGHGVAPDWLVDKGRVQKIWTEYLPFVEVPDVTAEVGGAESRVLSFARLTKCHEVKSPIFDELDRFVAEYEGWIRDRKGEAGGVPGDEREAASRIVGRMDTALGRMRRGVELLRGDARAAKSFALANQAMLDQMRQADRVKGGAKRAEDEYRWRPFQLAFIIMLIESAMHEDSDCRDLVDLIWFPTGGGKTEAYLGLIAFLISWRRLSHPASGGGTAVLMRYTLRLLTSQQYLRATRMVCALELIRRQTPELGKEPITIGMWVGAATSPNTFKSAHEAVVKSAGGDRSAPRNLVLVACPWCARPFRAPDNYQATLRGFHFLCTNDACAMSPILPCNVVDEALYSNPPTFLVATIDKFARLAWDERTSALFGKAGVRPPELIIQDELHLIAGALGSVAALYEAALDTVLRGRGVRPKYIASTATIRMADQQVRRLYGKSVAVFPPPGLSCDDSYFAKTVTLDKRPGRLYVGYLAPALDRQNCMAPLAAALLAAPEIVFDESQADREELLEAWWTQVVYHGSLKGVGNSHTAFTLGVQDHLKRYIGEAKQRDGGARRVTRTTPRIAQLTGRASAEENARTFARLEKARNEADSLDAVLATNMISVGLDVGRLALMIINGQPLTTAEYIQASSRVGRDRVPGLVFANYYRDQARSLSHYENFRPYHESFYRFVEPTSITPYTYQARLRALHAALVISIRHSCAHLLANGQASSFDPRDPKVGKVIEELKRRCGEADGDRAEETARHIDQRVAEWCGEIAGCKASKRQLDYQSSDKLKNTDRLMHSHDDTVPGLWPTLNSMRNVESSALLKLI